MQWQFSIINCILKFPTLIEVYNCLTLEASPLSNREFDRREYPRIGC